MTNWNDGYVVDIAYTYGYYPGMNPARLPLAFAFHGLQAPAIQTACELGFGQGLSTNFHAAASTTRSICIKNYRYAGKSIKKANPITLSMAPKYVAAMWSIFFWAQVLARARMR